MDWIEDNVDDVFGPEPRSPQGMVLDYAMKNPYPLPQHLPKNWTWLTAPLRIDERFVADALRPWPANHILWDLSSRHRVWSLSATMNYFDVQLAVHLEDLLATPAFRKADLAEMVASILSMGRVTYLMLPCSAPKDELSFVRKALQEVPGKGWTVGLRGLTAELDVLVQFKSPTCTRSLIKASVQRMLRGVRHYWCYHSQRFKHKFDFQVLGAGKSMRLKQMVDGRKTKQLADKFIPNINFAELLGWGLSQAWRELFFYDMLTTPNYPDPFQQNWLLTLGGRAVRIDISHGWRVELTQHRYITHLRDLLCLPHEPRKFPQCDTSCAACIAFRWSPTAHPPIQCTECYTCVRADFFQAQHFLRNARVVPDCDAMSNVSDLSAVLANEHKCYPYTARTVHARDMLSFD